MIKPTQSILPADARPAATTAAAKRTSDRTSFASAMRTAAAKTETETKTESKSATAKGPRNEKLQKVDGHKYSEIVGGPRNGMYVNQSGNERDGQAFLKIEREGRSFHVYGTGRDRIVFEVEHDKADTPAAKTTPVASTGGIAPPA